MMQPDEQTLDEIVSAMEGDDLDLARRILNRVRADVQADMRAEFVATADVLYFNGGYTVLRRGMVERVARESAVTPEPDASEETTR